MTALPTSIPSSPSRCRTSTTTNIRKSAFGTTLETTPNFVGFKLLIDGKPVTATPEERAIYNGKDVTAQVRAAGAPVNVVIGGGYDKLQKLPKAVLAGLTKAGLIDGTGGDDPVHAKWTTTTKFWWKMHFPAHSTVSVDHTYQPVTGQTFFTTYALQPDGMKQYTGYCIDAGTAATLKAKLADFHEGASRQWPAQPIHHRLRHQDGEQLESSDRQIPPDDRQAEAGKCAVDVLGGRPEKDRADAV